MKLLVLCNNALSKSESNGRITRTLLNAFEDNELYNFALRGAPNIEGVSYCMVSDSDALKSFVTFGFRKPKEHKATEGPVNANQQDAKSRSAFNHCLRDVVWFSSFWRRGKIKQWLSQPFDAVFLMAADAPFLYRLAADIASKQGIPLVIYSSEDYYLKRYDYMKGVPSSGLWARLFLNRLRKEAGRAFRLAKVSFLCSDKLKEDTCNAFPGIRAETMHQPSVLTRLKKNAGTEIRQIVYAGNINEHRLPSLIEIAEAIKEVKPELSLRLYGKLADDWSKEHIEHSALDYQGEVFYGELLDIYRNTDLLIHAESFDEFTKLDYAHAFSTKIGDCYASGIPFFIYGPEEIPCVAYGLKECPEFASSNKKDMKEKVRTILEGKVTYQPSKVIQEDFDANEVGKRLRRALEA